MNAASALVLAAVVAGAALVVWRNLRKGAPCSCGDCCGCGQAGNHCHCHEHDRDEMSASNGKSDLINQ